MSTNILVEAEDSKHGCVLMMWGGLAVEELMKGCILWEVSHTEEEECKEEAEVAKCLKLAAILILHFLVPFEGRRWKS